MFIVQTIRWIKGSKDLTLYALKSAKFEKISCLRFEGLDKFLSIFKV